MFEMSEKTGVAIIFFNRPNTLKRVFEAVCKAKPKNLFLIQDGSRGEEDEEKIKKCREIVEKIDWDCNVYKNYSDVNLGCGKRPQTGISWVFEHVERAIILEDDCVPQNSFFRFCDELLEKYADDKRVLMISGLNPFENIERSEDYFFAMNGSIWGWATWRRAWSLYDYTASKIKDEKIQENILRMEPKYVAKRDISHLLETNRKVTNSEKISYWDHQWRLVKFIYHNVCIIPKRNLINNIGDVDATHPGQGKCEFHNMSTSDLQFPLKHPNQIMIDYHYDDVYYQAFCPTRWMRIKKRFFKKR